ncbi:Uncharacterised protein [Mycobacteroides abscessus subsp. abscessus]|nr:Uncharacterised protein [Mycobacteroides abscessus subsp. abscessus]
MGSELVAFGRGAEAMNAVRRSGWIPTGRAPSRCASSSHHAPAALMTVAASKTRPEESRRAQRPCRRAPLTIPADFTMVPPRRRRPRTYPWCRP